MKLIIAGSRSITDYGVLIHAMALSPYMSLITEIVSGNAPGVDLLGERYARDRSIPVHVFPAKWSAQGLSAGPRRNMEMAAYSDALLALWDGHSKVTTHMFDTMKRMNKPYFVYCPGTNVDFSGNLIHLVTFPTER